MGPVIKFGAKDLELPLCFTLLSCVFFDILPLKNEVLYSRNIVA